MAVDIAPELYKQIAKDYNRRVSADPVIDKLVRQIRAGVATQSDLAAYAQRLGEISSDVLKANIALADLPNQKLYWNIAEKTIAPVLTNVYDRVNSQGIAQMRLADKVRDLGIGIARGINPVNRIKDVLNFAVDSTNQTELDNALTVPVISTARKYYDDFLKANADIRSGLGFDTVVVREYDGVGLHDRTEACSWCLERAGKWDYSEARAKGVFERHPGCGCSIEVIFPDRVDVQTDWTTNTWLSL